MWNNTEIVYDDDNDIALMKIYDCLSDLLNSSINRNGDGEIILKKSGLSSLCDRYRDELTPYSYNGKWQNENLKYNPQRVFFEIYPLLDDKHRLLFLRNIVESANFYSFSITKIENSLAVLGFALKRDTTAQSRYTVVQTSKGLIERSDDISLLEHELKSKYPEVFQIYDEALSTFGNGEYKSSIDNCRTIFEKITREVAGSSGDEAILQITGERVMDGTELLTSKRKLYSYWLDNRKGANRYRYFTTLYSVMSGLGTHGEEMPTRSDAILILRALEDILVWILQI